MAASVQSRPATDISTLLFERIAPAIVLFYLLVGLIVFLVTPVLFLSSVRTPFLGAFIEHTLILNTTSPTQPGTWALDSYDLPFGYQVVSIDGQYVRRTQELLNLLRSQQIGDEVALLLSTPQGSIVTYSIKLQQLPLADQVSFFVIPYLTGFIYLISGMYVFAIRRNDPAGRAFTFFVTAIAICLASLYDIFSTNVLVPLWTVSLAIAGGAMFNLAVLFPESLRQVSRYPFLRWAGYLVSLVLSLIALPTIYNYANPAAYVVPWRFEYIFLGASLIFFLSMIGMRRYTSASPVVREQARLIFWGALLSFGPMGAWLLLTPIFHNLTFSAWLLLPLGIFPVFTGYTIIRYRLLRTDYLLSRAVLYALLTALAISAYALFVSGLTAIFGGLVVGPLSPLAAGVIVFILALVLNPTREFLQKRIDGYFFRGQIVYREKLQAFGRELTQAMEMDDISPLLRRYVDESFAPEQTHIFIYDPLIAYYLAVPGKKKLSTSDVRFPLNSNLVQVLSRQRESIFVKDFTQFTGALQADQARIALLGAQLFVPLPGRQRLIGWLALGPRRSGEPYTSRDLEYLETLSDQTALAVERAQVVSDLERRVREMNVLSRVAQGISFTVAFDDMLELIYAQTNQLLRVRDFRVTLYDPDTETLYHAFYVENDERVSDLENKPLPTGGGLEFEVITSQRPLITDDYERECRRRGQLIAIQGIYGWMGVPLNAGAQTIGVISLASRDPAVAYTDDQRGLVQAIADQTSGAIIKARLLLESERRARQLAMLNEIGIGLTSTLDLKRLLNQILHSAVDILTCEAGSLFLVDEQTGELVFEVVIGSASATLTGRRLPPGTGLVGEAAESGHPIIANDAKRRKEWFEKTDIQTGFDTQDMLVVPMRIQDRTIGVIEVINKRNGAPFGLQDQDLLSAFVSQATIAIENARLYTLTDQALAARVEELSVMQRIDRELNASLEIDRAMRITLDWAMRQSKMEAGLVGTVENAGVRVMVHQGYQDELPELQMQGDETHHHVFATPLPGMVSAIDSGLPVCLEIENGPLDGLLKAAKAQIVVPIRRETDTIGVLLLESAVITEPCPQDLLSFLSRLSDHAAIAIANSRLYEEVNEANLAKSRFVSFVAHELKNPMASIKGYTELVAGGMAGPVNEMQSSFLATVRSNVDRMNTIVSDLNDLTKIQTGNLRLEYRAIRIMDVLDEVVRSLRRQIDDKEQKLVLELPEDLPLVWADTSRVAQVLVNLVSNAQKYTPQNGEIEIAAGRYTDPDETLAGVEFVQIWVRDSGIGITDEDQKKIFQQYFRTDSAKEMASGTGLGLNITRSLVEMQGGRIWFESVFGQGTTFHFTLPVAETA
jgi:signal transduction histidine kinase